MILEKVASTGMQVQCLQSTPSSELEPEHVQGIARGSVSTLYSTEEVLDTEDFGGILAPAICPVGQSDVLSIDLSREVPLRGACALWSPTDFLLLYDAPCFPNSSKTLEEPFPFSLWLLEPGHFLSLEVRFVCLLLETASMNFSAGEMPADFEHCYHDVRKRKLHKSDLLMHQLGPKPAGSIIPQ